MRRQAGFTLVETIVTLALAAMLLAYVIPAFNHSLAHWWRGQGTSDWQDQWMLAVLRLTEDLDEALPVTADKNDPPALAFEANAQALSFVRHIPGIRSGSDLQTVHILVEHDSNGDKLRRGTEAFNAEHFTEAGKQGGANGMILFEGPYRLSFKVIEREEQPDAQGSGSQRSGTQEQGQGRQELPLRIILRATPVRSGIKPVPLQIFPIVARLPMKQIAGTTAQQP